MLVSGSSLLTTPTAEATTTAAERGTYVYDALASSTTPATQQRAVAPIGRSSPRTSAGSSTFLSVRVRATRGGPDEFGPFHRREGPQTADEMAKARAGQLDEVQGGVNRGGYRPSVDAHTGPLPPGQRGYEFFTPVRPRRGTAPGWAQWPLGHPGVRDLGNDRVAIPCRVTRCR